jgi:hypothetical protein
MHLNTFLLRPYFLLRVRLESRARIARYIIMKEIGARMCNRRRMEFVDSCQGENVKKIFPVPVGHIFPSFRTLHTLDWTGASTDRLYKKVEVGESSARVVFE